MAKKRPKTGIKISFVGTNATEVTGSMTHVSVGDCQFLIEAGMNQSSKSLLETYRINNRKFDFKSKEIECIIMLHSHLDHCGLLPLLVKRGFSGKIYVPEMNYGLIKILLEDCCYILEKDSETLKRQGHDLEPIYDMDDVKATLELIEEIPFHEEYTINDNVKIKFSHSGHITNSAHGEIWLTENNVTKKIYYTSDLGNTNVPSYYVHEFEPIEKANLVIGESTYANPLRQVKSKDREKDLERLSVLLSRLWRRKVKFLFLYLLIIDVRQCLQYCMNFMDKIRNGKSLFTLTPLWLVRYQILCVI